MARQGRILRIMSTFLLVLAQELSIRFSHVTSILRWTIQYRIRIPGMIRTATSPSQGVPFLSPSVSFTDPPPPSYNGSGYSSTSNSDGSAPLFTKLSNSHNNTLTIIRLIWTRFSPSRERQASGMEQAINFCQGILVMSSYTERLRALAAVPQLPCMTKDLKWPRFWQPDFLLFQQTSQTSDVICANSRTPPQSPHSVRTFYPIYLWFMNYGLIFPIDLYLIVQNST